MEEHEGTPKLFISYVNLTPDFENLFGRSTHKVIVENLRSRFPFWKGFFENKAGYSLGFIIVTVRGNKELDVKGPSTSRKLKVVDYSIFLPDKIETLDPAAINDIGKYLDLVFSGISLALARYKVLQTELEEIKNNCKQDLGCEF